MGKPLHIAFIGLGNMGAPIARNLLAAGFAMTVSDLDPDKVAALADGGAIAAPDAVSAVVGADIVMTSLPGPAQIRSVGADIIPKMTAGSTWIDLSTNDLPCAREIEQLASAHHVTVLDAPITGGVEGAAAGTLTVLVGGDVITFQRCASVFDAIGDRVEHLGQHGAGYVAKISQVMLCYLNSVCLTEALLLGAKGGVDPTKMLDIIRHSTGRSYVADQYGPEILGGGYDDTFDLGLAAKDLRLALDLASDVGATLNFTADVSDLYEIALAAYGFNAPHLIAMNSIEQTNEFVLHEHVNGATT